jgi:hypothetical protein
LQIQYLFSLGKRLMMCQRTRTKGACLNTSYRNLLKPF